MDSPAPASARLVGWKDIAAYLGRSVRAVQRWERELGLPIHRVRSSSGQTVYALRHELDEWLARVDTGAAQPGDEASAVAVEPPPRPARRRRVLVRVAMLVFTAAVIALGWFLWPSAPVRHGPTRFRRAGSELHAFDDNGKSLWIYRFPRRTTVPHFTIYHPTLGDPRLVDLNGDGTEEVLAVVSLEPAENGARESEALYCWSADGDLLWRYAPDDRLSFEGGMTFGPSWKIAHYTLSPGSPQRVWVSLTDGIWWASFIARIEANGNATRSFVHGGIPYSLAAFRHGNRNVVTAATVSNQHRSAALLTFDGDAPEGRWPQEPSQFRCGSCGSVSPLAYVLLPPSDVTGAEGQPYNAARYLSVVGESLFVQVEEILNRPMNSPIRMFRFDMRGEPQGYAVGDGYSLAHARLEEAGRVDHRIDVCPHASRPLQTRMWTSNEGWRDTVIPVDNVALPTGSR